VRSVSGVAGAARRRRWLAVVLAGGITAATVILGGVAGPPTASAQSQPQVGLGTATSFAVLASTTVTNTGPSVISGDLGVSPDTAVTGFPPGIVINGTQHAGDAVAAQAQSDLVIAYNDAAGRTPDVTVSSDLGGQTLAPGVYNSASSLGLTGTVTLDAQGDPDAVFIFQAGSTLTTASSSTVALIGGAQACNVFWQVGSSATLGTNTTFVGSILALTSASVQTGATVAGRVLARNGQVSLDTNTVTQSTCDATPPATTTTLSSTDDGLTPTEDGLTPAEDGLAGTGDGLTGDVIPGGHPATGAGGASRSGDSVLAVLGGLALVGAVVAMGLAIRRRRLLPARDGLHGSELGEDE
jgi:Ice-binding-like